MKEYYVQGRDHSLKKNVARKKFFLLGDKIEGQKQKTSMQRTDFKKGSIYRKYIFSKKD